MEKQRKQRSQRKQIGKNNKVRNNNGKEKITKISTEKQNVKVKIKTLKMGMEK